MDNKTILKIRRGSHLYGTTTATSDTDYMSVFVYDHDSYLGISSLKTEIDFSIPSKDDNNKNTPNAIDHKAYELRAFVKMAMQCNPNILETLFVNDENIITITDEGRWLLDNRKKFLSLELTNRYLGYAVAQKRKYLASDSLKNRHDNKYLMHLVRLLYEARELLSTGDLKFPLSEAPFLTKIKLGNVPLNLILEISGKLQDEVSELSEQNNLKLPNIADFQYFNNFTIRTIKGV